MHAWTLESGTHVCAHASQAMQCMRRAQQNFCTCFTVAAECARRRPILVHRLLSAEYARRMPISGASLAGFYFQLSLQTQTKFSNFDNNAMLPDQGSWLDSLRPSPQHTPLPICFCSHPQFYAQTFWQTSHACAQH